MSKYDPLRDHLMNLKGETWGASFAEIERILGFSLPASARNHSAWWANEAEGTHIQARAWLKSGWRTRNLNLTGQTVEFSRFR